MAHTSVLLEECIDGLALKPGDVFVDGTLNGGGHSFEIAERTGNAVRQIGIDLDSDALARTEKLFATKNYAIQTVLGNFRDIDVHLAKCGLTGMDGMLLDLGWSSNQFEASGRGFSFKYDEPLVMSFRLEGGEEKLTAWNIVNEWGEDSIVDILSGFGEERFARRIARAICARRETKTIDTTFDLVHVIESSVPAVYRYGRIHPATRTFQALRIAVNDEINSLKQVLPKAISLLKPGGRLAIISFHSIEDRYVKYAFLEALHAGLAESVTKKPITPNTLEIKHNPRSRSAKLRILIKK
jgi:16S rRNA (cytosine1402-N4)-methyltransferase